MVNKRSLFKACLRKIKVDYDANENKKLLVAKYNNAHLYWKMSKDDNIPKYSRFVNNPEDISFTPNDDDLYFF